MLHGIFIWAIALRVKTIGVFSAPTVRQRSCFGLASRYLSRAGAGSASRVTRGFAVSRTYILRCVEALSPILSRKCAFALGLVVSLLIPMAGFLASVRRFELTHTARTPPGLVCGWSSRDKFDFNLGLHGKLKGRMHGRQTRLDLAR